MTSCVTITLVRWSWDLQRRLCRKILGQDKLVSSTSYPGEVAERKKIMKKVFMFLLSLVVKKKRKILSQDVFIKEAREQFKQLRAKGLQLPIITL